MKEMKNKSRNKTGLIKGKGNMSFLLWREKLRRLTFSCPCLSSGAEIRRVSRPPPSSCWRCSSPPPGLSASPPPSSSPPGASASAAQTYRAAEREEYEDKGMRTRTRTENATEAAGLTKIRHTDLSLFFFQLCFRLFHFVHKHLSHLLLFTLQVAQELFPLGLVRLLETERRDGGGQE